MSWETFVVGSLELKPDLPLEKKVEIIDEFEETLETNLVWEGRYKEYSFSCLNWSSHVNEDDIKKCYQKHKRHIRRISISLWYLTEADFSLCADETAHEALFGRWPPLRSTEMVPALDYLFGTLMPPGRATAEA